MVKPGQLRQWNHYKEPLMPTGTFLVLHTDPRFSNERFWKVLKANGRTKLWSESRILSGSEVISEAG